MVVVQLEQLHRTHGKARKDGPPPNHNCGMLVRYNDVFTNVLLKKSPPRSGKQLCSTKDWVLGLCGEKWNWWIHMKMVKAIQEEKWPLTQKGLRSLVDLANYYHRFIQKNSKVARILLNLLKNKIINKNWNPKSGMSLVTKTLRNSRARSLRKMWSSSQVFTSILRCRWRRRTLPLADVDPRWMTIAYESIKLDDCRTLSGLCKKWLSQEWDEPCHQVFG